MIELKKVGGLSIAAVSDELEYVVGVLLNMLNEKWIGKESPVEFIKSELSKGIIS